MANDKPSSEMTAADAAKLVSRVASVLNKEGKATGETKQVAVKAGEVLSFRDYGDYVVVVTTDGQKLRGPSTSSGQAQQ